MATEHDTGTGTEGSRDVWQWLALIFLAFVAFAPQEVVAALVLAAARVACAIGAAALVLWLFKR